MQEKANELIQEKEKKMAEDANDQQDAKIIDEDDSTKMV